MPWESTGKKPGKRPHAPYKVAITLLYGVGIPGVKRMGDGQIVCTIKPLSQSLRMTGRHIKEHMQKLKEWGVVTELEIERTYFVARLAAPKGFA